MTPSQLQLQIAVLYPAELAHGVGDERSEHGGQYKADEQHAYPAFGGAKAIACHNAYRAHKAAGTHAACHAHAVFHFENAGSYGAGYCGNYRGRQPYARIFHYVAHLQHACAKPLRHKAAIAVFLKAHHGKANHLRAAAGRGCAAGKAYKPRRTEGGAYCGAAYGQRERNAHQYRYQNHNQHLYKP